VTPEYERPEILPSKTTKIETGYGNLYVTVTESEEGKPFEVFATIGKSGGSIMAKAEVTGRMASLALRYGIPVQSVIRQLKGISGDKPHAIGSILVKSIPDAVAQVLEKMYPEETTKQKPAPQ
jgi:ribonucleoside-diphosphate reductase alpha chain